MRAARSLWVLWLPFAAVSIPAADPPGRPGISDEDYARLRRELDLLAQPWARIPWHVSMDEARAVAVRERKPLFLQINTGNPVGFA